MGNEVESGQAGDDRGKPGGSAPVILVGIWVSASVPDLARVMGEAAIADFRGRSLDIGSGVMAAEFPDGVLAARAAMESHRRLAVFNRKLRAGEHAEVRVGLAESLESARRLAERAAPGQVLISHAAREALILEPEVHCTWAGKLETKEGAPKQDVFEIIWADDSRRAGSEAQGTVRTPPRLPTPPAVSSPTDQPTMDFDFPRAASSFEDRYEVLAEVGRGGMGVVYKARDRETSEIVALKVLKPEIAADASVMERFKNELRLARKITHKNVCRIHEFNRTETSAYISMEMIEGDSLRSVLFRFGPLSLRKGLDLARQMCQGLAEAHAQGVVHRDLKPENIMLDPAGNAKVMDFGIARAVDVGATTTGTIFGTPAYMAPEQAEGKPVDRRTDIYSLGLILYEMFAGSAAFSGDTPMSLALKQMRESPPPPCEIESSIPEHLDKAILKCLEKNPAKRFQSVTELEAALTAKAPMVITVPQAEVTPAALPYEMANWVRFDWALTGLAVVGLGLFFWLFYTLHPASALQVIVDKKQQEQLALEALKKLGLKGSVESSELSFGDKYYRYALKLGNRVAHSLELEDTVGSLLEDPWISQLKVERGDGKSASYSYAGGIKGRPLGLDLWTVPVSPAPAKGPPPGADELDRMRLRAQEVAGALFGRDLSSIKPTTRVEWETWALRYDANFIWELPGAPPSLSHRIFVGMDGRQVIQARDQTYLKNWDYIELRGLEVSPRGFLACPVIGVVVLLLFFLRKIYGQRPSGACLIISAVVGLIVMVGATALHGEGPAFYNFAVPALIFCVTTLASYAALKTALYYLRAQFPAQAASFIHLFERGVRARPAGLALVRGILLGIVFSGFSLTLVTLAGSWGKAFPGTLFWAALPVGKLYLHVGPLDTGIGNLAVSTNGPGQYTGVLADLQFLRVFPSSVLLYVGFAASLLVALPLSLLGRVTTRTAMLLAALAAFWMALGVTLPGPMTIPTIPFYIMIAAQAVLLGWLFLRYGLLATWAAAFTIEALLLVYPLRYIFAIIDPWPYDITLALWGIMALTGAVIFFFPQLTWTWRRWAVVFE